MATAQNAPPANAAKAFGARERVRQASISPDGQSIAVVQALADPQAYGLFVAKTDGSESLKGILASSGKTEQLNACNWVTNKRLICEVTYFVGDGMDRLAYTRLAAVNADGSKLEIVSARTSGQEYDVMQDGGDIIDWMAHEAGPVVLMTRKFSREFSTGVLTAEDRDGLGVERVDTETLRRSRVEPPKAYAAYFLSDQFGNVRFYANRPKTPGGYDGSKYEYFYRTAPQATWAAFGEYDLATRRGFWPLAVDRQTNSVIGRELVDGRMAIVRISLDGSMKREVVIARPGADAVDLIRLGRQKKAVGVTFASGQVAFFDPALQSLSASLSKALPAQPQVRFVDMSLDENRLLLWAGDSLTPGQYYLYDKAARKVGPIAATRPELAAFKMAPSRLVTFRTADGRGLGALLTLPVGGGDRNLPAIVIPRGAPAAQDEWGFEWLAQFFAARGYAVLQPNFRSGPAWFERDGFQSWKLAVGELNDAGRWLKEQGIAADGKLAVLGWSYGGYAALQSQALDPDLYRAVVAIAPATDLNLLREDARRFTHFRMVDAYVGNGAHVTEGSPLSRAAEFKAPVLLFHGEKDTRINVRHSRDMAARLRSAGKSAELVIFPDLNNDLNDSRSRTQMLEQTDAFLRRSLGL